ncbi:MarR family transcriptional regulator [Amycolatopsis rhizosphaerae]|uniref:MarR family transcriptional regulator n=1 Tax=Amycolatopsis rhizosphaerae TaxID=2053003 RepID=A0A558CHA0_9PSEU|nr:MarR family transcriptional regulator [Amycolatopsis rhizosphaerae]TVT48062.1 MarR family transcriptional regulator [Amycolatopsis rhizosphaerae]
MKPLGYWLKQIDGQLETAFDHLLAEEAVSRRQWQILNTLATGPRSLQEIDEALAPFRGSGCPTFQPVVAELVARGWAQDGYALTGQGRLAHQQIAAKVHAFRGKTIEGLSEEDYATLVGLLERVSANLAAR